MAIELLEQAQGAVHGADPCGEATATCVSARGTAYDKAITREDIGAD